MQRDVNDRKLLAAVAAAVLLVVGAVVLTAIQMREVDATPVVARAVDDTAQRRPTPTPPATAASLVSTSVAVAQEIEEIDVTPVSVVEVTIDPDADFAEAGQRAFALREFDLAVAYFQAESERRPERSWPHYMLGLSLWKAGKAEAAEVAMSRATESNPTGIKGWINLSRIRNDLGRYAEGLEAARSALALEADQPQALFLEGRSLANLGRIEEALTSLDASLQRDADNGFVQNLAGLIRLQRGDAAGAVDYLQRAAELSPDVGYVHNNLGMALERSGRIEEAMIAYRQGAIGDPRHAKLAANLSRLEAQFPRGVVAPSGAEATIAVTEQKSIAPPSIESVDLVAGGTNR